MIVLKITYTSYGEDVFSHIQAGAAPLGIEIDKNRFFLFFRHSLGFFPAAMPESDTFLGNCLEGDKETEQEN